MLGKNQARARKDRNVSDEQTRRVRVVHHEHLFARAGRIPTDVGLFVTPVGFSLRVG